MKCLSVLKVLRELCALSLCKFECKFCVNFSHVNKNLNYLKYLLNVSSFEPEMHVVVFVPLLRVYHRQTDRYDLLHTL
jgi:hypothetical protein